VEGTGEEEAALWADSVFTPHVSLVYSAMAPEQVRTRVLEEAGREVREVREAGVVVGPGGGWKGGRVVLVQTWRDLKEWVVLAEKVL